VSADVFANGRDRNALFYAMFTCAPDRADGSLALLLRELDDLLTRGPSAAELRAAQAAYKKVFETSLADDASLARALAAALERDRTMRFEEDTVRRALALSPADFLAAIRRHVHKDRLVKILAGDLPESAP
jgi:predicted Zn-dependent peptidase